MKTEKFDEAVKRKVESIDHRFEEKDIDKVLHFVNTHRGPAFFRSPFRLLVYSLSTLVVAVLTTWQITKWHDNKVLNETIAELKNKSAGQGISKGTAPGSKTNNITTPGNNNTGYSNDARDNTTVNQAERNSTTLTRDKKNISHNKQELANNETWKTNKNLNSVNRNFKSNKDQSTQRYRGNDGEKLSNLKGENFQPKGLTDNNKIENKDLTSNELTLKKQDSILQEKNKLAENKKPEIPKDVQTYRNAKETKKTKKPADIHILAGGVFTAGDNNQLGGGITGDLILNRRFGFSAGVKVLSISTTGKTYSEKDYNDICDEDFRDKYDHDKDRNNVFIDSITTQSSIIQVPVSLSIYQPLGHNFAISASVGTDLDLYKYQEISFKETTIKNLPPPPYHQVIETSHQERNSNGSTALFNNIVFSVGFLKQWNHIAVQVSPYWAHQFVNTDYKLESEYFGGNIKLLYSFGIGGF
jgi:hypothetical protein